MRQGNCRVRDGVFADVGMCNSLTLALAGLHLILTPSLWLE